MELNLIYVELSLIGLAAFILSLAIEVVIDFLAKKNVRVHRELWNTRVTYFTDRDGYRRLIVTSHDVRPINIRDVRLDNGKLRIVYDEVPVE